MRTLCVFLLSVCFFSESKAQNELPRTRFVSDLTLKVVHTNLTTLHVDSLKKNAELMASLEKEGKTLADAQAEAKKRDGSREELYHFNADRDFVVRPRENGYRVMDLKYGLDIELNPDPRTYDVYADALNFESLMAGQTGQEWVRTQNTQTLHGLEIVQYLGKAQPGRGGFSRRKRQVTFEAWVVEGAFLPFDRVDAIAVYPKGKGRPVLTRTLMNDGLVTVDMKTEWIPVAGASLQLNWEDWSPAEDPYVDEEAYDDGSTTLTLDGVAYEMKGEAPDWENARAVDYDLQKLSSNLSRWDTLDNEVQLIWAEQPVRLPRPEDLQMTGFMEWGIPHVWFSSKDRAPEPRWLTLTSTGDAWAIHWMVTHPDSQAGLQTDFQNLPPVKWGGQKWTVGQLHYFGENNDAITCTRYTMLMNDRLITLDFFTPLGEDFSPRIERYLQAFGQAND